MTKFLRIMLGAEDPMFSHAIKKLEAMTGKRGIDIIYTTDVMTRAHAVMKLLSLDPKDTTAKELYHALDAQANNEALFDDLDDVAVRIDSECVSFNHHDVVVNHGLRYSERQYSSVRLALYEGLVKRYAAHHASKAMIKEVLQYAGIDKKITRKDRKS